MHQALQQIKPPCWRRCAHRNNHIVVNFNRGAGLNDRFYIINHLANLAGYLCAELHVPVPAYFLSPHHNRGENISHSLQWADLQNWTWVMPDKNGQSLMNGLLPLHKYELANLSPGHLLASGLHQLYGLNQTLPNNRSWYSTLPMSSQPQFHVVAGPNEGVENVLHLEQIVTRQWEDYGNGVLASDLGNFMWEIPINPYDLGIFEGQIRNAILKENRTIPLSFPEGVFKRGQSGCRYIAKDASRHVEEVTSRVWNDVHDSAATMGFLHIRRGDATAQCNTTLSRLKEYFRCSFADTERFGRIKMMLATDETDSEYLGEMKSILEDMYPHVTLIHLDPLVEKHTSEYVNDKMEGSDPTRFLNNFFTFQVDYFIQWQRAAFSIVLRRNECNKCDYLSAWHSVKWVGLPLKTM
jgi:hypothetical protein